MHASDGARERLARVCQLAYSRQLTIISGGNFSLKLSTGHFLATPSGFAKRTLLRMPASELLEVDLQGNVLEGEGLVTSSWRTHSAVYQNFQDVQAIIHAHPHYATAYSVHGVAMPALLSVMKKYGDIPCLPARLTVDTQDFAKELVAVLAEHSEALSRFGFAVLYPSHGVLIASPDLESAYDLLERVEANALALVTTSEVGCA